MCIHTYRETECTVHYCLHLYNCIHLPWTPPSHKSQGFLCWCNTSLWSDTRNQPPSFHKCWQYHDHQLQPTCDGSHYTSKTLTCHKEYPLDASSAFRSTMKAKLLSTTTGFILQIWLWSISGSNSVSIISAVKRNAASVEQRLEDPPFYYSIQ